MKIAPAASAKPAKPISNMQVDYCSDECKTYQGPAGGLKFVTLIESCIAAFGDVLRLVLEDGHMRLETR